MPTFYKKTRFDLAAEERNAFLADCWDRGEAPSDEAWKSHLRLVAHEYLRWAHDVLNYCLDPKGESSDSRDEAADYLIARLNQDGWFRLAGHPIISQDESGDDPFSPEATQAWDARLEALRTMRYPDYLQTPEWAERRRGALRRAGHACEACGGHGRLNVHHRTYERRGKEKIDDLRVLCDDCHVAVHTGGGSHRPRDLA
jgi:hypothetical protein